MIKKKTALVVAGTFLFATSAASAGHYYEAVTATDDERGGDGQMTVSVWVEGDSTKIEFAEGKETGFFGPGTYMVTRDAGELMYLVNTEDETYSEFDLGQIMNMAGQVMEGMGSMFKIEFTDVHSEKISESPGESILGYSTKHLRFQSGYTMRMAVMGMKQEQRIEMDQEMWTTSGFDTRAFSVWLRPDKRMGGMIEGLDEMMETEFSKVDGVPLKSVMHMTTTDKKGRTTASTSTTEVTVLREESVADSTFEIPAGYQQVELMPDLAELEGMQGEDGEEEEEGRRPRLRDLMKRRKDR